MDEDIIPKQDDFGGSWNEKQNFITRFMDELGAWIDNKCAEFEIPAVVVVGALEILKSEYINGGYEVSIEHHEDDEDDSSLPFETSETD